MNYNITNKIEYIGVNDKTLDLFESQYNLPNGVSYNSYILKDKKTVVMDTVDKRVTNEWLENIETTLNKKNIDLISFAPHKFYGLNGFGALIKNNEIVLEPLINGGASTTLYRSGTPVVGQICALEKALDFIQ